MKINLPPLPAPLVMVNRYGREFSTAECEGGLFTAEQTQKYATEAVMADREQRKLIDKAFKDFDSKVAAAKKQLAISKVSCETVEQPKLPGT